MSNEEKRPQTFEEAYQRLQDVVRQLESGQLTLDESLVLFQEGVELARVCSVRLDEAEKKIERLTQDAAGVRLEPLQASEEGA